MSVTVTVSGTGSFGSVSAGSLSVNSYTLPLFNNGTFSGANKAVIPVSFYGSVYNLVEIKVTFICSVICDISISGNTASNGTGTTLSPSEAGETTVKAVAQGTPVYTTTGLVATACEKLSINNHLKMSMSKGNTGSAYANRNLYSVDTCYCYSGFSTARVYATGHFDSTALASVVLTCSTGTISGTYNTVYSY